MFNEHVFPFQSYVDAFEFNIDCFTPHLATAPLDDSLLPSCNNMVHDSTPDVLLSDMVPEFASQHTTEAPNPHIKHDVLISTSRSGRTVRPPILLKDYVKPGRL